MVYTIIWKEQSYDLPPKTLKVVEAMDKAAKVDSVAGMSITDKFKTIHGFIISCIGKDNAKEIFGDDRLDKIDLSEVTIVFRMIVDAYKKPIDDYIASKSAEKLEAAQIDKVIEMAKAAQNLPKSNK